MEKKCDILIVGGGPSGVSAAIAAAEYGARIILIEEDQMIGGAPIDMYVGMACGGPRKGFYKRLITYLNKTRTLDGEPEKGFTGDENGLNRWWLPYDYAAAYMFFLNEYSNIEVLTGVTASEVITEEQEGKTVIKGVRNDSKEYPLSIYAQITIDATGTGLLGALAGCDVRYGCDSKADFDEPAAPTERSETIMPCTLKYITQRLYGTSMPDSDELKRIMAVSAGFVEDKLYNWSNNLYESAVENNRGIYLHWGATIKNVDTRSAFGLASAYMQAFARIQESADIWERHGFKLYVAPKIGVRENRRVMGEAVITMHNIIEGKMEQDTVVINHYGFDLWGSGTKDDKTLNEKAKGYGIPFRALIPKGTEGLLMAGKSISGSHLACSSYRVQPIVTAIGEATGFAAALAVKKKTSVKKIAISKIQAKVGLNQ